MELGKYHLKENPFRLGPPLSKEDLIWIGFDELKKKIENRISLDVKMTPSRIVLNWGRYGSGKTHAANYFTKADRIQELATLAGGASVKAIKVNLPRTTKDPVQAFLRSFLGQISLTEIHKDFKELESKLNKAQVLELVSSIATDSAIERLFHLIIEDEGNALETLEGYLFGDSTKGTLNFLGLPFGIRDDEQVVNFLCTYISCITYNKQLYSRFFLWIDEFEDIDTLNKLSQDRITTFLRQVFDKAPSNLTIFLNFTPKTFFNVEDLSIILGEALATRAKLQILFKEPTIDEGYEYIVELINHDKYRTSIVNNKDIPFDNGTIKYVLEHIGRLSIRKINEVFSLLIELGLIYDAAIVDNSFIERNKEEILSWEK